MPVSKRIRRWLVPTASPLDMPVKQPVDGPAAPSGLHHFQREVDSRHQRLHLRVEADGSGLLLVDAMQAVRMTRAGAFVAYRLLAGTRDADIVAAFADGDVGVALLAEVRALLDAISSGERQMPVFNLADPALDDRAAALMAPFQADVELTGADAIRTLLDKLWDAGLPHVRLRTAAAGVGDTEALAHAIERAEDLGMIAGARLLAHDVAQLANGDDVLHRLAMTGLDYVVLPWGIDAGVHDKLFGDDAHAAFRHVSDRLRDEEVTCVAEVPLLHATAELVESHDDALVHGGQAFMECYAIVHAAERDGEASDGNLGNADLALLPSARLRQTAASLEELSDLCNVPAAWLPAEAVANVPSVDELRSIVRSGARAGGDVSIRIAADGAVYPPRGPRVSAGNLLEESFADIWQRPPFKRFRERVESATRCDLCPGLAVCAADCPADPKGWAGGATA